ncbi:MAG: glutathione S-transferase [Acidimicrobiales bacterium]|nr:glutathione S-transferase [Hyphomonadaceae bacterium]RZV43902.1 MAG: glutathione S-transferase [Acidimicrobiales bacterium]
MKQPTLYVFAISHYCEKARWAMDRSGIDYKLKFIAPGVHAQKATKLGLKSSSVPILTAGEDVIQGSSEIIDWIDRHIPQSSSTLTPSNDSKAIESRLDEKTGVHVRRYYYSEAMVDCPETVKPMFKKGVPFVQKLLVDSIWSKVPTMMIKGMDLGPEQHLQSKAILDVEMDWLDGLLADGRPFLAGDQLSRADLAAASLLAPLVVPDEHPTYDTLILPPRVAADAIIWAERPVFNWVKSIYQQYR